jgi:hypothetical protein
MMIAFETFPEIALHTDGLIETASTAVAHEQRAWHRVS